MNLEKARAKMWETIAPKSDPVEPERIRRYEHALSENHPKYMRASRTAAKKTAEMSRRICVG